eukprot:CAMPEP_0174827410 /NCGR_PEP_ID=MMETSP1114-20130205/699_1 /TAXON_ID=312471 /ORGANISM="Neobodo designis, Strain CCAP 1951/1" /LENGTH=93 /DNA_ID=CAMNT_0016061051 /DNA_START=51 /DNA_END=332 /DNA_ORIENTATION=+
MAAANTATPPPQTLKRTLPHFFPTFHDECQAPAETFFQCFEEHARMKNPKDTQSCKLGVNNCIPELEAYEKCETVARANDGKKRPWWKFWGKK